MDMLATALDMQMMDRAALKVMSCTILELMEEAAGKVAEVMEEIIDKDKKILIVCGKGNNGGDGFALACLLSDRYDVRVLCIYEDCELNEQARYQKQRCLHNKISLLHDVETLPHMDVIVDAIFGTGLSKNIVDDEFALIEKLNKENSLKISIDMPSGIHADTGQIMNIAFCSDIAITFQYAKRGMYLYPGYEYSKKIIVKKLSFPQSICTIKQPVYIMDEAFFIENLPIRHKHSHKGTYGKALLIGGSPSMHGAITLAGSSCLHTGVGTLTMMIPESIKDIVAYKIWEAMLWEMKEEKGFITESNTSYLNQIHDFDVVGIGCGLGRTKVAEKLVCEVLNSDLPCVIDADGIYALQYHKEKLKRKAPIILTPHPKEMSYLCNKSVTEIISDPIHCAVSFCKLYPSVVLVLKSEHTIIVHREQIYMNIRGNHSLAKGGSGDVLCGAILAFLAQGKDALKSACAGVHLHAVSADELLKKHSSYYILPHHIIHAFDQILFQAQKDHSSSS